MGSVDLVIARILLRLSGDVVNVLRDSSILMIHASQFIAKFLRIFRIPSAKYVYPQQAASSQQIVDLFPENLSY